MNSQFDQTAVDDVKGGLNKGGENKKIMGNEREPSEQERVKGEIPPNRDMEKNTIGSQ